MSVSATGRLFSLGSHFSLFLVPDQSDGNCHTLLSACVSRLQKDVKYQATAEGMSLPASKARPKRPETEEEVSCHSHVSSVLQRFALAHMYLLVPAHSETD